MGSETLSKTTVSEHSLSPFPGTRYRTTKVFGLLHPKGSHSIIMTIIIIVIVGAINLCVSLNMTFTQDYLSTGDILTHRYTCF